MCAVHTQKWAISGNCSRKSAINIEQKWLNLSISLGVKYKAIFGNPAFFFISHTFRFNWFFLCFLRFLLHKNALKSFSFLWQGLVPYYWIHCALFLIEFRFCGPSDDAFLPTFSFIYNLHRNLFDGCCRHYVRDRLCCCYVVRLWFNS